MSIIFGVAFFLPTQLFAQGGECRNVVDKNFGFPIEQQKLCCIVMNGQTAETYGCFPMPAGDSCQPVREVCPSNDFLVQETQEYCREIDVCRETGRLDITLKKVPTPTKKIEWTKDECDKMKTLGLGEWVAPAGETKGPYCFVPEKPVELAVSIAGVSSTTLGQYLSAIYRFLLGAIGLVAVIMIMIGGIRWAMAAGGPQVAQAKTMIINAVIGLILAFGSYVLLQTINPALVTFRMPRIPLVKADYLHLLRIERCGDYTNQEDCERDPFKVAGPAGCFWQTPPGEGCWDRDKSTGKLGGPCRPDKTCDQVPQKLFCVKLPIIGTYLCTNGADNQPCNEDKHCANNKCDPNLYVCLGKSNRPTGAQCDNNEQCESKNCVDNKCALRQRPGTPCIKTKDCLEGYICRTEYYDHKIFGPGEGKIAPGSDLFKFVTSCQVKSSKGDRCCKNEECVTGKCEGTAGKCDNLNDFGVCGE